MFGFMILHHGKHTDRLLSIKLKQYETIIVGRTTVLIIDSIETKPIPYQRYYYIAGGAIVLGIIAVCLFPLWPMEARQVIRHHVHLI